MIKIIFAAVLSVFSVVASAFVAFWARHYQVIHQQMPNGKGGLMAPSDGYLLATALLLLALASLVTVVKKVRSR